MLRLVAVILFVSLPVLGQNLQAPDLGGKPNISTLSRSGFIIGPDSVHKSWQNLTAVMAKVDVFDHIVERIEDIICGPEQNRSVLLIGEPSDTYSYIFARLGVHRPVEKCGEMWHVEIDTSRIESGNGTVGAVDQYWETNVLSPADGKRATIYFKSLGHLIGLGTHKGDDTGIEAEYVSNIQSGRLKSIAFINKYEYQHILQSKDGYVPGAFAEKITIEQLSSDDVDRLVTTYLDVLYPHLSLPEEVGEYLYRTSAYFQPNVDEPQRSLSVLKAMVLSHKGSGQYEFTFADVRNAIMSIVQVPTWLMTNDYTIIKELPAKLEVDVVGVKNGKKDLIRLAEIGYVAGKTDEKPIGTALLVGPTGTGKSYISKKLAEYLGMKLITIDMTAFKSEDSLDRFLDIVSNALITNPYAVYLFEEIDKAATEVLDRLYFMMDEGIFYDRQRRPLFARGAYIVMTTNAAQEVIVKEKDNPKLKEMVNLELLKHFRASFINRFDAIPIFMPFNDEEFQQLATVISSKKGSLLKEYFGWTLTLDEKTVGFLATHGKSAIFGARPLERLVENVVGVGIAKFQLAYEPIPRKTAIAITKEKAPFSFTFTAGNRKVEYVVDPDNNSGVRYLNQLFLKAQMNNR